MASYRDYDTKTLKKLHETQIEILDDFVSICKKHNLTYFLIGGSLLGAVRHQGFIPWDDDIDIGMPRKDYDEFIKIGTKELGNKYYLDCFETNKDFYLPFAKIKMNGTIFDEEVSHNLETHKGIYIDIFAFENIKNTKKIGKIRAIIIKSIVDTMFYKHKMRSLKKVRHASLVLFLNLFPKRFLMKIQQKLMKFNKNDNSLYVNPLSGSYAYEKETNLRTTILPVKEVLFEGKYYNGMNDNDTYLKKIYGDYMKLPPEEKRRNHMPLEIKFKESEVNERSNNP